MAKVIAPWPAVENASLIWFDIGGDVEDYSMMKRVTLLVVFACVALTWSSSADARRFGRFYSSGYGYGGDAVYGSYLRGGLLGGQFGWYGERRGFYGGFSGAYFDGARVRPLDDNHHDPANCEDLRVKVVQRGVVRYRQVYRCH